MLDTPAPDHNRRRVAAAPAGVSPIWPIVQQHADDAAFLWAQRAGLVSAPNAHLEQLQRHDDRLDAHLDGLRVAGEHGWAVCEAALESPSVEGAFVATVCALERGDPQWLRALFARTEDAPAAHDGVCAGFGWVEREQLAGVVVPLLGSSRAFARLAGIAACVLHGVNPGPVLARQLGDASPRVRAGALLAAGELGCRELMSACISALDDNDEECRFWAAWAAVMLGDRLHALAALAAASAVPGPRGDRALRLSLQAMSRADGHRTLQQARVDAKRFRSVIHGSGIVGDPAYVPWLVSLMSDSATARLAGEAFAVVTGADLAALNLESTPPDNVEAGPDDDPDDADVDMDPDEGVPWPDPARVQRWWEANEARFQAGRRYFMGAPVTREHCVAVLKTGYQRQRILAARYLCLLDPGTPLFNTSAPAWRQRRLLAEI